jgi:hypothetical protein
MQRILFRTLLALFLLALTLGGGVLAATGGYNINWSSVDGGGGNSTGGGYRLSGSAGQTDAVAHSGGGYQLQGGFWYRATRRSPVSGANRLYLPVAQALVATPTVISLSSTARPMLPIINRGEVWSSTTLVMPTLSPGNYILSADPNQVQPILVDDELALLVGNQVVFRYDFGASGVLVPTVLRMPPDVIARISGQNVTLRYADLYGAFYGASPIYLVKQP